MVAQNGPPGVCLFCIYVSIMCIGYTYIQNIIYIFDVTFIKCTNVNKNI